MVSTLQSQNNVYKTCINRNPHNNPPLGWVTAILFEARAAFLIIHTWHPLKICFLLMVFMLLINHRPWEPDVNVIRILKLAFQRPQFQAKQFTMTANDSLASSVFPLAQSTKTLHLW